MKRLRDLRDRLDALVTYPREAVIAGRIRLEADPDDQLLDLEPYARDQAKQLYRLIEEMKRVSGGGC